MTTRALKSKTSFVWLSMTRTPDARLVRASISTSDTVELGRTVRLPVSRAGKISAVGECIDGVEVAAASAAAASGAADRDTCWRRLRS